MPKRDYYEVLNVPRDADADQIKRAYRTLAKKFHPDRNPNDKSAESRFKEVQEAYDTLGDPQKRKAYDRFGHAGAGGAPGAAEWRTAPGGQRVYTYSSGGDIPIQDLEDLFSVFAGQAAGAPGAGSGGASIFDEFIGRQGRRRTRPGPTPEEVTERDIEQPVTLTFDQAVRGATLDLELTGARGATRKESIRVKIPPGVADGQRIRVRGKGRPAGRGGKTGDLYVVCRVQPHPYFRRVGDDIYLDLPLSITEAALGAKVEMPTLDGTTVLTVPAGTPSGARLRLKDRGVKPAGGKPRGHQYAVVRIVPPKPLSDRQRELLQELQQVGDGSPRADAGW